MKYFILAIFTGVSVFFATRVKAAVNETPVISPNTETPKTTGTNQVTSASNNTIALANNNPLNIRETSDDWVGLANPRAKKGFFNFVAPEYGIRAGKKIILGAYAKRGLNTVQKIISAWAPPSENNTGAYISFVERDSGLRASTVINAGNIRGLLVAMARMESGKYWPSEVIDRGMTL